MPGKKNMVASRGRRNLVNRSNPTASRIARSIVWNQPAERTPQGQLVRSDNRPYRFSQIADYGTLVTTSAGGQTFGSTGFKLNDLTQASSFQAIFDQYRIAAVEVWITTTSTTGILNPPSYCTVVDYDDAVVPSNVSQLLQYTNCAEIPLICGSYYHFVPHATAVLNTGSGVETVPAPWINSATPAVIHYGIKVASYATATTFQIQCRARFHVEFRNVF